MPNGNLELQDHDRDDDRQHPVAERLQPTGPHPGHLPAGSPERVHGSSPAVSVLLPRPRGPHGDLDVVVAAPGYFSHAKSLVERLGAVVDGEHVEDQILAVLPSFVDECAAEAGADAVALILGVDFDAGEVDLGRPVFDVDHADVDPIGCDDLPAVGVERTGMEVTLALLIPPPDGGDVIAHGGLVQLEAELAVGGGGRPQRDGGHAAACSWRSPRSPSRKSAPARGRTGRVMPGPSPCGGYAP